MTYLWKSSPLSGSTHKSRRVGSLVCFVGPLNSPFSYLFIHIMFALGHSGRLYMTRDEKLKLDMFYLWICSQRESLEHPIIWTFRWLIGLTSSLEGLNTTLSRVLRRQTSGDQSFLAPVQWRQVNGGEHLLCAHCTSSRSVAVVSNHRDWS